MKNSGILICRSAAGMSALCIVITFMACSPGIVTPLYQDAEFTKVPVAESVYLMPVIDLRVDKSKNLRLDDNAFKHLSPAFEKKGFRPLRVVKDRKLVESMMEDDFTQPDSSYLATLGPAEARWLFFPLLHDFKSKLTFGSTANAEISGYIIDKKRGRIVWRHKGIGQAGQGGLIGMAMKGMVGEEAVNSALHSLAAAIPKNAVPAGKVVAKK